jgi:hypothetical protein
MTARPERFDGSSALQRVTKPAFQTIRIPGLPHDSKKRGARGGTAG